MNIRQFYILVRSTYFLRKRPHISYGIALVEPSAASPVIIKTVSDISRNRTTVTRLVNRCNALHLNPDHLCDVIEDFLS